VQPTQWTRTRYVFLSLVLTKPAIFVCITGTSVVVQAVLEADISDLTDTEMTEITEDMAGCLGVNVFQDQNCMEMIVYFCAELFSGDQRTNDMHIRIW